MRDRRQREIGERKGKRERRGQVGRRGEAENEIGREKYIRKGERKIDRDK